MTDYDRWLDELMPEDEEYVEEGFKGLWEDEPAVIPSDDYDNYDGWDDMQ